MARNAETRKRDELQPEIVDRHIVVDPEQLRRAQLCKASGDVRYYLNGVALLADGRIIGTNGHHAYIGNGAFSLLATLIIDIKGAIPKRPRGIGTWQAHIHAISEARGYIELVADLEVIQILAFTLIEAAKYPDVEKAVNREGIDLPVKQFGINASYLALVRKVFIGAGRQYAYMIRMEFFGEHAPVKVTWPKDDTDGGAFYVMPCRLE